MVSRAKYLFWEDKRRWLWVAILVMSIAGWVLPFVVEREGWSDVWEQESGLLSSLEKRYLQLNTDQAGWILLSSDFPYHYWHDDGRINRPIYPMVVSVVCRLGHGTINFPKMGFAAFVQPCSRQITFGAALAVNWVVLALSVFGFYWLLRRWHFANRIALISAAQLALSPMVLWHLSDAATNLISIGIAVAALWLFTLCSESLGGYATIRRAWWSGLALGVLVLAKPQYDILFLGWIALAYLHRWRATIVSFLAHLIPVFAWIVLVESSGLNYRNEAELYGQGVWIWREFVFWSLKEQLVCLLTHTLQFIRSLIYAFGPLTLAATAVGVWKFTRLRSLRWLGGVCVGLGLSWAALFAIRRPFPYLLTLHFYSVYPLAAHGLDTLIHRFHLPVRRARVVYLVLCTAAAWLIYTPATMNFLIRQHW
jgi:hypothetical protein